MIEIKKKYKLFLILLGGLFFICVLSIGLISTSFFQNKVILKLSKKFTESTNQKVFIEGINLNWNGSIEFKNFYLEDHHKDTLIYIQSLNTSLINLKNIKNRNFEFSDFVAEGLYLNLKKYNGEKTHSLKILLEKLKNKNNSKSLLKINKMLIDKLTFFYVDENNVKSKPLKFNNLKIGAENFNLKNDEFIVTIKNLDGFIHSPFHKTIKGSAFVKYKPGFIKLDKLKASSGKNNLEGNLIIKGKNNSLRDFMSNVNISMKILSSKLDIASFNFKNNKFQDIPLTDLTFNLDGTLEDFRINDLNFTNTFLTFTGKGSAEKIFNDSNEKFNITTDSLTLDIQKLKTFSFLSTKFKKLIPKMSKLRLNGNTIFNKNFITFNFNSINDWGLINTFGNFELENDSKKNLIKSLKINSDLKKIDLSNFFNTKKFLLDGKFQLQGNFLNKKEPKLFWNLKNGTFSSIDFLINDINVQGRIEEQKLINTLSINSQLLELKSDLLYDYSKEVPSTTLLANINKWDLNKLGLKFGNNKQEFKGIISSNLKGNKLNNLTGEIKISSASISNKNNTVSFNPIALKKSFDNNKSSLEILNTDCISGLIKGNYKTSELGSLFQNALHRAYPFIPKKKVTENQSLKINLKIFKKLLDALYPNISLTENIILDGEILSNSNNSQINLETPFLNYNNFRFENLNFRINSNKNVNNSILSINKLSHPYFKSSELNLTSKKIKDTIFFQSNFKNTLSSNNKFKVNFYFTKGPFGTSHFGIKRSTFPIGKNIWTVNPDNQTNQKISYNKKEGIATFPSLTAYSKNQSLSISGTYSNKEEFGLVLDMKNISIEEIIPKIPSFSINGKTNFRAKINRSLKDNQLNIKAHVSDLKLNNQKMGDFMFSSKGNTKLNTYISELSLIKEGKRNIDLKGVWQGLESPRLDLNIVFQDLALDFLSPLGKKALNKIKGFVNGNINLWGSFNNLKHEGKLTLSNGGFSVPVLNLDYLVEKSKIDLSNQSFLFKSIVIKDINENTSAIVNGSFSHSNFKNWSANLTIDSDRMLLLNTKQNSESLFFGKGFLDGKVHLEGFTKNLNISLEGSTEVGTSIKIPWTQNYGLSDISFVKFVNKKNKNSFKKDKEVEGFEEIKGLEMDFRLDVNNKAAIEIVIDKETGSYLSGSGVGNLFMEIDTKGKFNMWGDFSTYAGIYNFKNLGLIDKKFNVKPGGTIVWEGDPLNAQMNLKAVYEVPGGANPALLLDNPNFNKNIPTEVSIILEGNLLKPDDPVFEINFPNTSGIVASEINYRLADQQRSQLQALSLLSQGIFINEVSVSMQGITNNLYQKASDVISNLIGEDDDKLKVGIDYLQGDKSALLDIATEDRLGFTLSTKISEKILLNGKIGVPVGGVEQTLIVGNVQIDFILNDEGSLRAKVFNKENEFRYIGDELGYTQGVGLSYDVDFNTFKQLIKKITSEKENSQSVIDQINNTDNNKLIEFINKN